MNGIGLLMAAQMFTGFSRNTMVNSCGCRCADFGQVMETKRKNAETFDQIPEEMNDIFRRAAFRYKVPEELLKAVAKAESDFDPLAVSPSGAVGVMQLMPGTARELGVEDSRDPEQNIMGGAKYLAALLEKYDGETELALAAYNAGSNNVDKYGGIPPFEETQNYVRNVMSFLGGQESIAPYASEACGCGTETIDESGGSARENERYMGELLKLMLLGQQDNSFGKWL